MKRKLFSYLTLLLLSATIAKAQLNENFTDSNFIAGPPWVGSTNDWVIDPSLQLQSNDTVANSSFYLSTPNMLATSAQWELYVQLKFNTSSANYVDVYLTASASDLTKTTTAGYFVRIGSTNDDICLYRKDPSGTIVKIIDGVNGILNTSNNTVKIKVTRDAEDSWTLYRDVTGTGMRYFNEGSVIDTTYTTSSFFGILVKQSTASFFRKHFFDGITITPFVPDTTPPKILSATGLSLTKADVLFDEALDSASSRNVLDYSADNGLGNPIAAMQDTANLALVHLTFAGEIPDGISCQLTVNGVKDITGNAINDEVITFYFYEPQQYDMLIDEIMADPSPQVSLPNNEWIELKNVASFPINLKG